MDMKSEHLKRKRTDLMIRKAKNTGGEKAEKKFSRTMSNDNLPKSSSVSNMIDTWHDSWSLQSEWWCLKDSIESTSGICDKQKKMLWVFAIWCFTWGDAGVSAWWWLEFDKKQWYSTLTRAQAEPPWEASLLLSSSKFQNNMMYERKLTQNCT